MEHETGEQRVKGGRVLALVGTLVAWLLLLRVLGPLALLALGVLAVPGARAWLRPRRWAWWQIGIGASAVVAVLVAVAALAPAGRLPLPPGVGTWVTPSYLGRAAVADPVPAVGPGPAGPLGDSPEIATAWYAGADCGDLVAVGSLDRLVAVCGRGDARVLRVVDAATLRSLVSRDLPPAPEDGPVGCGGALAVDGETVVVATTPGTLDVLSTRDAAGAADLTLTASVDVSQALAPGECLVSVRVAPQQLWWAGSQGAVGTVEPTGGSASSGGQSLRLPGGVANPITVVDDTAYVVTTTVLAAVGPDPAGRLEVRWRSVYDAGTGVRSGQLSAGSGTAPTLLTGTTATGPLLALVDNADPRVRLRLVRAQDGALVCQQTLFADEDSAVESDPVPVGVAGVVVANAAGWTGAGRTLLGRAPAGGMARVDLVDAECVTSWTAAVVAPSVGPVLSPTTGLVYAWATRRSWWGVDAWYLAALDSRDGGLEFAARAGTGPAFAGRRGRLLLAGGSAYVATTGGLVRVNDRFAAPPGDTPGR